MNTNYHIELNWQNIYAHETEYENFDYTRTLSTNDKIKVLQMAINKKDLYIIGIILSHIRKWEVGEFIYLLNIIDESFTYDEMSVIDNISTLYRDLNWDFVTSSEIKYVNDYTSINKLIDEIKPENFKYIYKDKNKYKVKSSKEFIELMKKCFRDKIVIPTEDAKNNPDNNDEKKEEKRKGRGKVKKKDTKKVAKKVEIKTNIIPSSYLNKYIVEKYVKKQFNIFHEKKLKERENEIRRNILQGINVVYKPIINSLEQLGSQVIQQIIYKITMPAG